MALEAVRIDDKTPHQLLGTVFVTELDGKYAGSVGVVDLLRADRSRKVDDLDLTSCSAYVNAHFADVTLLMAHYNLTALALAPAARNPLAASTPNHDSEPLAPH